MSTHVISIKPAGGINYEITVEHRPGPLKKLLGLTAVKTKKYIGYAFWYELPDHNEVGMFKSDWLQGILRRHEAKQQYESHRPRSRT